MPVVLGDEQQAKWLGEETATPEELFAMLAPFPSERMSAWPVTQDVGKVKIQGGHLVEPLNSH
jgi:putative SOS response-associated peptidase YedK